MKQPFPSHISRYQVLDRLGAGGMGVVYLAKDPRLDRTVAIKVLAVHNEELLARFALEARRAAALKHQHIITIYDVGEDGQQPFLAMEYVDGETLAELIERRPPIGLVRKLEILAELGSGLAYAHRRKIVHRDIKPANVMLTSDGVVKIVDFGLARLASEAAGLTSAGAMLGTPRYMSPEQIEGKTADERSDIYAVGVVAYELLSYRKAYVGDTPHAVMYSVVHTQPPLLSEVCEGLDPEIVRIVEMAIAKRPDDRYQSLADFNRDLDRARDRVRSSATEPTVKIEREPHGGPARPPSGDAAVATPHKIPNLDAIARRRALQIDHHLEQAQRHLDENRFETAVEECELAAALDPDDSRILELLQQAHIAIDDRKVEGWLGEAEGRLAADDLSNAELLVSDALELRPASHEAAQLRAAVQRRRSELERAREWSRLADAAVVRARALLDDESLDDALRATVEALTYEPGHQEARALKDQTEAALLARQRAVATVEVARQMAARDELDAALALLQGFSPPHKLVDEAASQIAAEAAALEQQRFEAETRLREQHAAEARRLEDNRRRTERILAKAKDAARTAVAQQRWNDALAALEEARAASPDDGEVGALQDAVVAGRATAEAAARRRAEYRRHLEDARKRLSSGEVTGATKSVDAALRLQPDDPVTLELRAEIADIVETRRRRDATKQAAALAAANARARFVAGDPEGAMRSLRTFEPAELVAPVLAELESEWQKLQRWQEQELAKAADAPLEEVTEDLRPPEPPLPEIDPEPPRQRSRMRLIAAALVTASVLLVGWKVWPTAVPPEPVDGGQGRPEVLETRTVSINAVPWATVKIVPAERPADITEQTTPFSVALPVGEYRLEFRNPTFKTVVRTIRIGPQESGEITQNMPGADVDRIVSDVLGR